MNPVDAAYLLTAIEESRFKPKRKERVFLNDMRDRISEGKYLRDKQAAWLKALYRRSQGGGDFQKRKYT